MVSGELAWMILELLGLFRRRRVIGGVDGWQRGRWAAGNESSTFCND